MILIQILFFCALNSISSSKVVLRNRNVEILNSIDETSVKVSTKILSEFTTTESLNNNEITENVKAIQEITINSIDNDTEENTITVDDMLKEANQTCKDGNETDATVVNVNKTEELSALILTSFIEEGKISEARKASSVNSTLFLGVKSYSGYFTVNKTYNSNTFFWYFPVENKPVNKTPWIIWLQGGPGASSLTALFEEIGPFMVGRAFNLERNPYSWLRNHSLVFIDNPVGTGFSFTEDKRGYTRDMATYSSHLYSAFEQFLQVFPELRSAPLYVAGESYAGKYVPALGVEIHKRMNLPGHQVNLQGFIIGNAYVDPAVINMTTRPFYNFGLIEQEQMDVLKPLVDALTQQIAAKNSTLAKIKWMNLVSILLTMSHQSHAYNYLKNELAIGRYVQLMNKPQLQAAIHVRRTKFNFVNTTVNAHLVSDFLSSGKEHFETLLEHYRVLAYCGQLDLILPCITSSENYRTWKWNETDKFIKAPRLPFLYEKQRAGYHKAGGGLTEVVFLGAGHMVPSDTPAPAQDLVTRWTHKQKLSMQFPFLEGVFLEDFVKNNTVVYF